LIAVWKKAPILVSATIAMCLYSIGLIFFAWALGIHWSTDPKAPGYLQKLNWAVFPFYWPIVAIFVHFSWSFYEDAWRTLHKHGVLFKGSRENPVDTGDALRDLIPTMRKSRRWIAMVSLIAGIIVSAIDASCLWHEFGIFAPRAACVAADFDIAFRLPQAFPSFKVVDKGVLLGFVVAQYLMQAVLIAMAFVVLLQLLLHTWSFLRFERLAIPRQRDLLLRLNPVDPLREFGLSRLNRAINLTYIFIAAAMAIPVLSVANKPAADIGSLMMALLLPLVLATPAIIPIADRILRRSEVEDWVLDRKDPKINEAYEKQRLWPFEDTGLAWVGKICIGVALAEFGYVITREVSALLRTIGG
jgi:hypothetical protein